MMRRLSIGLAILGLVAGTAVGVWAAGGSGGGRVDSQSYAWTTDTATTSSTDWQPIPNLGLSTRRCHGNQESGASVSLQLAGGSGSIDLRVAVSDPLCPSCETSFLQPPAVVMGPGTNSFTFVGRAVGDHGTSFEPQWRVSADEPPNASATLEAASLHVLWKRLRGRCA